MCCLWFDSIDSDAVVETSAYMWDWCVYPRWKKKNGSSCSDGSANCSGLTVIGEERRCNFTRTIWKNWPKVSDDLSAFSSWP